MKRLRNEGGFTLVETFTVIALFAVVSVGFYTTLFMVTRGSQTSRSTAVVSEETRLGFNRMIRDTREAQEIVSATPTAFSVRVDFENDTAGPVTLDFEKSGNAILLEGDVLMRGVACVPGAGGGCAQDVFTYQSNRLEYDWNRDGVTTWQELDASASPTYGVIGVGNNDGVLNVELQFVSDVSFALQVADGSAKSRMFGRAQLRNRR